MDIAGPVLELSPYRGELLEAVGNLSALTPPASPHDWAAELEARGVPAGDCLALLKTRGLAE
ncbi:hypothetical protein [Massilia aquatica]|uniref:hypothetical protein n=1 Tax=Massilia aquatica TaxID=2609000 RepID=UPI001423A122|nr:hypothetical protein [Massilia aquatica]